MHQSVGRCGLLLGLVVLLAVGTGFQAQAEYTKLYRIWNRTGSDQHYLRVILNGLEGITVDVVQSPAWAPASVGFTVVGGVFGTTLISGNGVDAVADDALARFGWTTADSSCRLRDMRWLSAAGDPAGTKPIQYRGVPGGGWVEYDPVTGQPIAYWITNDTDEDITLTGTDLEVFAVALSAADLDLVLAEGLVGLRVAAIDVLIEALRGEIIAAEEAGTLRSPSANSLIRQTDKTESLKDDGLTAHLGGNPDRALFLWAKAAHQAENLISEITNRWDKGNVPDELALGWIATAEDIRDALAGLPGTDTSLEGFPLPAGQSIEIPLGGVSSGAGFVLCGSVLDADGNPVLDWAEQATLEPTVPDITPPVITEASITPKPLWPPDHEWQEMSLDVTVRDKIDSDGADTDTYSGWAVWYVQDVISNQPEDGTGDGDYAPDWMRPDDDLQSLWLRRERSGNHPDETRVYSVILQAIDMAGNLAHDWEGPGPPFPDPPYTLEVRVEHDEGGG